MDPQGCGEGGHGGSQVTHLAAGPRAGCQPPTLLQARFWFGYRAFYSYWLTRIVIFLQSKVEFKFSRERKKKKKPSFGGKRRLWGYW